ncbi:dephospho-CoA kinase [bacterium]|nr:dephospho-CoA kinase [bacterium]
MQKLGLTGNICAGKSEVENILEKKGYKVIDLDKIAHKFLENNSEIKNHFHTLDRKIIGNIVFSNPDEKKYLESILHPLLYNFVLEEFKKNYEKIVISGALLYEAGFDKLFDKIIFIDAPYDIRLKRLIKRNNLSEKEAKQRLDAQNNTHKTRADYVIENNSTLRELENAINSIL